MNEEKEVEAEDRNDATKAEMRRELFISAVVDAALEAERGGPHVDYKKCAMLAGYSETTAKTMAYYLRKKPNVQEQIRMRLAAAGISDAEIIGLPASVIRYTLADVIDIDPNGRDFTLNLNKAVANGAIAAVKKLGYDSKGRPHVEMIDKLRAVDILASVRGLKRAEVRPDDLALRRMAIEDDIGAFRQKRLIANGGDAALADSEAAQYREYLRAQPEFGPYMEGGVEAPTDNIQ